jgi:hypothetical protein
MDPDPGGPKTRGSGSGFGSATLKKRIIHAIFDLNFVTYRKTGTKEFPQGFGSAFLLCGSGSSVLKKGIRISRLKIPHPHNSLDLYCPRSGRIVKDTGKFEDQNIFFPNSRLWIKNL